MVSFYWEYVYLMNGELRDALTLAMKTYLIKKQ